MLFLAVFCGFLAEYQLEHKIEKEKEKQYVKSLVLDLAYDTAKYSQTIAGLEKKFPYYDSVLLFFKTPATYSNRLPYRYYIRTNHELFYIPNSPTIQQLKNSGNLRLITKKLVLDSILIYQSNINGRLQNQTDYVIEYNKRLIQLQETILDFGGLNQYLNGIFGDQLNKDRSVYDLAVFVNNPAKLQALSNLFVGTKASELFYMNVLELMKEDATSLMLFVQKEYKLN